MTEKQKFIERTEYEGLVTAEPTMFGETVFPPGTPLTDIFPDGMRMVLEEHNGQVQVVEVENWNV